MKFALMCCSCNAFLGKEGQVIIPRGTGVMFRGKMLQLPDVSQSDRVAVFATESDADNWAMASGWDVVPTLSGPLDHRCPDCLDATLEGRSPGAYVPAGLLVR